jgi:hypothetical protein
MGLIIVRCGMPGLTPGVPTWFGWAASFSPGVVEREQIRVSLAPEWCALPQ